ncbi:MAG: ABC transporter permease [Rudaea sp.]|nr:ABC transporter permease [Rudaea sp.]
MTLLPLALKSLANRRFTVLLTLATIALSVALLLGVQRVHDEARQSFASTISGTDLIVGARSGPVNLLLYSIFHIGDATNGVSWQSFREIAALPEVAWTVPISLGDSHRGFRVVGTNGDFFVHYRYGAKHALEFSAGAPLADLYDAVTGAEVARKFGYAVGQTIVIAHGTGALVAEHADHPFRIVGILQPTGTPVDASLFVSLGAVEAIHADWQTGARIPRTGVSTDDARKLDLTPTSITAFLVGLKSRAATFDLQRQINDYRAEPLLAILPGVALQQLWRLVGIAENALLIVSALVVVAGLLGMLNAMMTTLNERRREMAILRALGARPHIVFGLLVLEATLLTVIGIGLGLILLYAGLALAGSYVEARYGLHIALVPPSPHELVLLVTVAASGILAGCLPALLACRHALADGLSIRT